MRPDRRCRVPSHALFLAVLAAGAALAQERTLLITGAQVLAADGERFVAGQVVLVRGPRIVAVGSAAEVEAPADATRLDLSGDYLVPGLIDLHSHLLLRPYDEATWDDQVLKESLELRTIRATVAARKTLRAGFTTLRDLGTEGAGFADVALRDAVASGLIQGPRIFASTRALVATGCYGPSGFDPRWTMPVGAQAADGVAGVRKAAREQIAAGADWIKVYADYRRQPGGPSTPTFSSEELNAIVEEARSAGLPVAAHATTDQGARRAIFAGVKTIEHGYQISDETLQLMREHGVVLCPTLAANEAIVRQRGGSPAVAARLNVGRAAFQRALAAGVRIACGSDAGVFAHGDNAREIELMVEYGMTPAQALRAATSIAADVLGRGHELGAVRPGFLADLVALRQDPLTDPKALRQVTRVVKNGSLVP